MRRQVVERRFCTELIWMLAGFLAVQLSLAVCVETCWKTVRDPEFFANQKLLQDRIAENPNRPLVLVLGSSRTQMALRAAQLNDLTTDDQPLVFNFGIPRSGPLFQSISLERLLRQHFRPDLVVLEITPEFLSNHRICPLEERRLDPTRLDMAELTQVAPYYHRWLSLYPKWLGARVLPAFCHQCELKDMLALDVAVNSSPTTDRKQADRYGWLAAPELTAAKRESSWNDAYHEYEEVLLKDSVADGPKQAWRDLLTLCASNRLPAIMVVSPVSTRFREASTGHGSNREEFIRAIADEFGVTLVDARAWVSDADFWDGHHVSPAGATCFTDRFSREVLGTTVAQHVLKTERESKIRRSLKPEYPQEPGR